MMDDDQAREFVLEAAALMVQEGGAELLSHQGVAEAAGLPEATVRRLFPTIESLVTIMADRLSASFLDAVAAECGDDDSPGAWLRAYVRVGFALDEDADLPRLARALLCSVTYRPHMLDAVREREVEIQHLIAASGIPPERAVVVRAAMEGVFLCRMFGLELLPPGTRQAVERELLALTLPDPAETRLGSQAAE
jgi:AcrR family transcriptional regulator